MDSSTSKVYSPQFDSLPDEIVMSIAEYLDEAQLPIVRMLNRKFAKALKDITKIPPKDIMEYYAATRNLKFIRYLYKNKCPWNERTCEMAAFTGNLDCLQFLHENGCPWNERTYGAAQMLTQLPHVEMSAKGMECLSYAISHRCPGGKFANPYTTPACLLILVNILIFVIAAFMASIIWLCEK